MNKKSSINNLLYTKEHLSCRNYLEKVENRFKYIEFTYDEAILEKQISWNYLLFVLEGECIINCNQTRDRLSQKDMTALLPKMGMAEIKVTAGTMPLFLSFDLPLDICDKFTLQSLTGMYDKLEYNSQPLSICYPPPPYLEVAKYCLANKIDCEHFHALLQQELFFLLRGFYMKEELALLFYPIITTELSFKYFVIGNYLKASNVNDLISLSTMGKSSFHSKFKEVFGMSAKQWLLKQQDMHIINKVMATETTVIELMEEFKFEA